MNQTLFQAIILAAGRSSRFAGTSSKLLMPLCGKPLVLYPVEALNALSISSTLVIGYQKESIINLLSKNPPPGLQFVDQEEQRGTGHALAHTKSLWRAENIIVLNGDMPLVTSTLIQNLINAHIQNNAAVSFVKSHYIDPTSGYGRVVEKNNTIAIVEARHFKGDFTEHCFINAGIYIFKRSFLDNAITKLTANPDSHEIYITDLIAIASDQNLSIATTVAPFDQVRGVNTLQEFWAAEQIKRGELITYWMANGVYFPVAQTVQLHHDITIGSGTIIDSGVQLLNGTIVGKNCIVQAFCILDNAVLDSNVTIKSHSVVTQATIKEHAIIGPFAHVHHQTIIGSGSTIGNFVEVTRSTFARNSKAKHLSYIGDARIGEQVNIGAGTITCNYDGVNKHVTIIGDNTSIGSNNALIAPLEIGNNVITAAGSTITDSIPDNALAIARARQIIKADYALVLKKRLGFKQKVKVQKNAAA